MNESWRGLLDPDELARLDSLVPPELRYEQDPSALARGKRLLPYLEGKFEDLRPVQDLFAEGHPEWATDRLGRGSLESSMASNWTPKLTRTVLARATTADQASAPGLVVLMVRVLDWLMKRRVDLGDMYRLEVAKAFEQLAMQRSMDAEGWRTVLEAVPPSPTIDPELQRIVRHSVSREVATVAGLRPKPIEFSPKLGIPSEKKPLRACGTIDREKTVRELAKIRLMDLKDMERPRGSTGFASVPYVNELKAGLPEFPNLTWRLLYASPFDLEAVPEQPALEAYEAYAREMDSAPNTLGRQFLISMFASPEGWDFSFARRTFNEMLRGYAAGQAYRAEAGRLPESWASLISAGLLDKEPFDYLGNRPVRLEPQGEIQSDGFGPPKREIPEALRELTEFRINGKLWTLRLAPT